MVAVWILAVPPFRGADEFEHAYRAAGVATGQWRLTETSPHGEGQLVEVPPALADAAAPQCIAMPYKKEPECRGFAAGDRRSVTTAAGSYNPAYYALLGAASRIAEGASSLYAMRVAGALSSWLVIMAGLSCLALLRVRPAVWVAVVTGLTPAYVYSLAVASPNGIEMAAGFTLWSALLALLRVDAAPEWGRAQTWTLGVSVAAGLVLVTARSLGPLWAALIAITVMVFSGWRAVVTRFQQRRGALVAVAALAVPVTAASVAWTLGSGLVAAAGSEVAPTVATRDRGPYGEAPVHAWFVQAIAAFPYREQVPNPVIHLMVGLVLGVLLVMALRRGSGARRRGVALALAVSVAVPLVLSIATSGSQAAEWQGRYGLPYLVGIPLLAGLTIQDVRWRSRFGAVPMVSLGLAMLGAAQVWSVLAVQRAELARPVSTGDPGWVHGPLGVTAALAVAGCVCCALAVPLARRPA